eukprot:6188289-Pleurochrysis_carterae.AAC.3
MRAFVRERAPQLARAPLTVRGWAWGWACVHASGCVGVGVGAWVSGRVAACAHGRVGAPKRA